MYRRNNPSKKSSLQPWPRSLSRPTLAAHTLDHLLSALYVKTKASDDLLRAAGTLTQASLLHLGTPHTHWHLRTPTPVARDEM